MIEPENKTEATICNVCEDVADFLIEKNRQYGDSAINPVRVFSGASDIEQINVRMDDKLSRIRTSKPEDQEDARLDLVGYLILDMVKKRLSE